MENKLHLIKQLIKQTEELPFRDRNKLDHLKKRTAMIIGKLFDKKSEYIDQLDSIRFSPISFGTHIREEAHKEAWLSGEAELFNLLKTIEEDIKLDEQMETSSDIPSTTNKGNVFIVHGHNEEMKQATANTLHKLDLEPIILHEQPSKGRTIIEKLESNAEVSFAIVLLSADDIARSKGEEMKHEKYRARQNVIFELGFFIGKLGRSKVIALYEEVTADDKPFEIPSDYKGVVFVPYNKDGKWKIDLFKELKAAGFEVDANKIM